MYIVQKRSTQSAQVNVNVYITKHVLESCWVNATEYDSLPRHLNAFLYQPDTFWPHKFLLSPVSAVEPKTIYRHWDQM